MELGMALCAVIALGIALVLMYVVLRKYTYPAVEEPFFSDPTLFMLFTVGLVEGTIFFVVYTYLLPYYNADGMGLIVAVLFGVIMELAKLVTMNLKRFNGKSDSIFYGFSLGLGMGAAFAFGLVYYLSAGGGLDVASWVIIMIMVVQAIFLHAGTGTIIGEGVARYRGFEFVMQALLVGVLCQMLMVPTFTMDWTSDTFWIAYIAMGLSLLVAVYNFYRMVYKKLPKIVDDVLKMEGKKRDDIPGL